MQTIKNTDWMDSFFTRNNWSTNRYDDQLGNSWMAAARIILATATLLTNDPVKISRSLSLPLPYVSATIWNLDRNLQWTEKGYKDLTMLVFAEKVDEAQLSDALHSAMEQFWEASQPSRIDLVRLWASTSWATGDDLSPSPVAPCRAARLAELITALSHLRR